MWMRPSSLVPLTVTSPRGIDHGEGAGRGEREVEGLVGLVLVAEELVERVRVDGEAVDDDCVGRMAKAEAFGGEDADDDEDDEKQDGAAAD